MSGGEDPERTGDFAERLQKAIEASGQSPSRVQREAGLQDGYIFKLLGRGQAKQVSSPGPEVIRQLADHLKISYEWLAIGRGPMRTEGWAESPLESAMKFALAHGARRDAIDAAVERYRDTPNMTGLAWVQAFDVEARRLNEAGIPRPEAVEARHRKTRRLAKKSARQRAELADLESKVAAKRAEITRSEAEEKTPGPPKPRHGRGPAA